MIYIGADHRGFKLKEILKGYLKELSVEFEDMGALELNPDDDYPDFAMIVVRKVLEDSQVNRGILICGSGVGVDIIANKARSLRSALCFNVDQAKASRNDDNANVLALASDFTDEGLARDIVKIWLQTPFGNLERYNRRLLKIKNLEDQWSR